MGCQKPAVGIAGIIKIYSAFEDGMGGDSEVASERGHH